MKVLTSKKAIIVMLSLGSVVLAGTIKDINSRTVNRAHVEEIEMAPIERSLASEAQTSSQRIAVMRVEINEAFKIDGEWEITRIIGSDEVVTYDKINNPEDANKTIKVPMELIRTSEIMVNNDPGLVYKISLLSDFGTIAIYKTINGGQEILEAKRVKKVVTEEAAQPEEVELVLERALNQSKSTKILTGSEVAGEMLLTKNSIEGLSVSLTNTNGEVQNIDISSAQLMDGGSFKADVGDEEVAGVVFNNGKDGYRLSFVTGPLAGAMLNFVTKDALEEMQDKSNEANDEYITQDPEINEEALAQQAAVDNAIQERIEVAADENYEPVRILSADEVRETAETQGFAF